MSNKRRMLTNDVVVTTSGIGRDLRLVRMTSKIKKRLASLKTTKSINLSISINKNSKA